MPSGRIVTLTLAALLALPAGTAMGQEPSPAPGQASPAASPATEPGPTADSALAAAFPLEIGGIALSDRLQVMSASEALADDPTAVPIIDVAAELGVSLDDVEVGSAFTVEDPDVASGVLLIAIRVPGMGPETGRDMMFDYLAQDAGDSLVVGEAVIAGRTLTSLASADDPEAVAYVYAGEEIAWLVAAPQAAELEEAVSKLP